MTDAPSLYRRLAVPHVLPLTDTFAGDDSDEAVLVSDGHLDHAGGPSNGGADEHRPAVTSISLAGIFLPDSRTGALVDLGAGPAPTLVSLIRHRY